MTNKILENQILLTTKLWEVINDFELSTGTKLVQLSLITETGDAGGNLHPVRSLDLTLTMNSDETA